MPTTTKMGIVYPSSTDLVKDGATAMGTISTTVDSKTGLVLIKSASFSGVSSVSFDANTFSANYLNYQLIINIDSSNSSSDLYMRLRASGTDNSSSNYLWTRYGTLGNAGTYNSGGSGPSLATTWHLIPISGTYTSHQQIFISSPYSTTYNKGYTAVGIYMDTLGSNWLAATASGLMSVTTQYDSATIYPNSGTITGDYSIYGVNK